MSDSTPAPVLPTLGDSVAYLDERMTKLEEMTDKSLSRIEARLAAGPIHQSNGKSVLHALFLTKEGKASREKALAALLTAGPLILIPILTSRGVDPVLVSGIAAWFSTQGVSSWRARHQRDLPVVE